MKESSRVRRAAAGLPFVSLLRRRVRYRRQFGHGLPRQPATFTEKVQWRLLHDRRAALEGTCDKLAMKEHARLVAPDLVRVPRTLWAGTDITELDALDLPEHWVLKPNHGTGAVHLGHGRPDTAALAPQMRRWLAMDLWRTRGEWAYRSARPLLVVEENIGRAGVAPADLKVFVSDGLPRVVRVHSDRFSDHSVRLYTPEWEDTGWRGGKVDGPPVPRPRRLEQMLQAASALAAGFDMMRVDFYEQDDVLWFGELTPYPGGGIRRLDPRMDDQLGRWWTLPRSRRGGTRIVPLTPAAPDAALPPTVPGTAAA